MAAKPGTIDFEKFFPHIQGKAVDVWLTYASEPVRNLKPTRLELLRMHFEGNNEIALHTITKITFSKKPTDDKQANQTKGHPEGNDDPGRDSTN